MMEHIIIHKDPEAYSSFPHITRLLDGRLAVVFRKAGLRSVEAAKRGLATHHDPDSGIYMVTSLDEHGYQWPEEPREVFVSSQYGVNDPALTVLKNGDLLCRFVALNIVTSLEARPDRPIFSHRTEHGLVTTVEGNIILCSQDGGTTWEKIGITRLEQLPYSCSREPVVEMPDGSLLLSVYTGAPQRSDQSWIIRSFDGGRSWHEPILIAEDENGKSSQLRGINFNETALLHLGEGHMLAMLRADSSFHTGADEFMPVGGCGQLYTSHSYDSGMSWEKARPCGLWGQPAALIQLSDGRILATYGYRRPPYGVRAALSKDKGKTWETGQEIVIRTEAPTWDVGYPFSIEVEPGHILTVYYWVGEDRIRYIAATHWEL